jgi:sulfite exporter TauE/SafE
MRFVAYLLMRFSEPSSYAGLGALLALLGWHLPESILGQLIQGLAAACALLALVLKDRGMMPAIVLVIASVPVLYA